MSGESGEVVSASPSNSSDVSEAERGRAVVRLRDRYAGDGLSVDEFSRALDAVFAAGTVDELRAASPDLGLSAPMSRVPWLEAEALQQHLASDEAILWIGRPEVSVNLTRRGLLTAIPFVLFLVFWESTVASGGGPVFFLLWGVVVACAAGYQTLGRVVVNTRRTLYAVTTHRVVRLISKRSGDQLDSILVRMIPSISVTAAKSGRGTILFGPNPRDASPFGFRTSSQQRGNLNDPFSFIKVPDAAAVARLIGSLQAHESQ
jgi:hypothetical protein